MVVEESAKGQAEHEEHHDQDGASVKMVLGRRHEGVPEGRVNGLKTGIDLQTKQEDIRQDIKYCLGMDDIMLPVYNPVSYKPGFSWNRDRADQKHFSQIIIVCALCKDGPRCKYSDVKEPGSARSIIARLQ